MHDLYKQGHASLIVSNLYPGYPYHPISISLSLDITNPFKTCGKSFHLESQTH